jgi:Tol biopolymer transport system component
VPALGGDPQLIVPSARLPKFSPDGDQLVCATQVENYPWMGEVYVVSRDGGNRRRVAADLRHASYPIWSPDGTALLMTGIPKDAESTWPDWYVVRLDEGGVVKTGAVAILRARQLIPSAWAPQAWSADGWVFFSAGENDSVNLWKLKITPKTWEARGPPVRVTVGAGIDQKPSLSADGSIVFSSTTRNTNLWSLPLEARSGKVLGSPAPLTRHPGVESFPYLTPDGSRLVYILESGAERSIQLLELRSGLQRSLTPVVAKEGLAVYPIPNKTGSRIAFSGRREDGHPLRVVPAAGGAVETVCPGVPVVMPWSWSWNGRFLAHRISESPITIGVLDIESCERGEILAYPGGSVFQAEFSPDDQWIAFMGDPGVTVAPFEGMGTVDPSRWIKVSDSGDKPRWAPDGNSLYFTSQDEGRLVIYRQALDPGSKTPIGEPSVIHRFDSGRFSFRDVGLTMRDISVSIDRIVFPMVELTGNVWLMEP